MVCGATPLLSATSAHDQPRLLRSALILTAALPIMSIYPILAMRHGHEGFAAAALLATTTLSFFTLSALIGLLQS